jgi:hypothetical protein
MIRILVGVLIGAAVTGSVALAAGGGSGTVSGCYPKHGGTLKISLSGKCPKHQTSISWNKQGATGPGGVTGGVGATGPAGVLASAIVTPGAAPGFLSGHNSGFQSVSYNSTMKVYCLVPAAALNPATTTATVAPVYASGLAGSSEFAELVSPTADCAAADFEVATMDGPTPVDTVPFSIVVP